MSNNPIQTLTDELLGEIEAYYLNAQSDLDGDPSGDMEVLDTDGCRKIAAMAAELRTLRAETERLQRFEAAFNEWHDKTEWVQAESPSLSAKYLGCHRADVMRDLIESLRAENAELRKDAGRYRWLRNQSMEYRQNGPAAIMAEVSGEKGTFLELDDLDAAIDIAMEQAK
jgi:hypothetical protein